MIAPLRFRRVGNQNQKRVHEPLHLGTIFPLGRKIMRDVELYPTQNLGPVRRKLFLDSSAWTYFNCPG